MASDAYASAIAALVAARQAVGVSQRELAARLGKPRSFVSKIEGKERRVDVVEFVAIARALQIEPEELIGRLAKALPDQLDF